MRISKLARFASMRLSGWGAARPTRRQKRIALAIAGAADLLQLVLAPLFGEGAISPFDDALDVLVAGALLVTLGWQWRTVLALGLELIPGAALFPTWTAVIASLPVAPEPAAAPTFALASAL
jgi:hypothetical protein